MAGDRDLIIELSRRVDRLSEEISCLREDLGFQRGKLTVLVGSISAAISLGVSWLTAHM